MMTHAGKEARTIGPRKPGTFVPYGPTSRVRSLQDDAQGQPRGAAALHQPGDLVPVEAVGVDLGQRPGDAESGKPVHSPVVHEQLFAATGLVCHHDRSIPSLRYASLL